MVSRKKNQGKARKVAKAIAREAEERRNNQTTNANGQAPEAEAQMQPAPPTAQNGVGLCRHGFEFEKKDDVCAQFVLTFTEAYNDAVRDGDTIVDCLIGAVNATEDEFAEVWSDSAKMESLATFFLYLGAESILEGLEGENGITTRGYAIFARYFEQHIALELHQTQAMIN
jgi:hypothetical protein